MYAEIKSHACVLLSLILSYSSYIYRNQSKGREYSTCEKKMQGWKWNCFSRQNTVFYIIKNRKYQEQLVNIKGSKGDSPGSFNKKQAPKANSLCDFIQHNRKLYWSPSVLIRLDVGLLMPPVFLSHYIKRYNWHMHPSYPHLLPPICVRQQTKRGKQVGKSWSGDQRRHT